MNNVQKISTVLLLGVGAFSIFFSFFSDNTQLGETTGFGILQMTLFLMGITAISFALYIYVLIQRPKDAPRSLQADIGVRLICTGLVATYVAGFSDLLSIGTHVKSHFDRPYFGPLQQAGIGLGIIAICCGLWLYHTSRGRLEKSSINFLAALEEDETNSAEDASK